MEAEQVMWWCSPRRALLGVPVAAFRAGRRERRAALFTKVEQALLLIRALHPRRFRQVRRDVGRILVSHGAGWRGMWHEALRMCVLDGRFVGDPGTSPGQVACVIVHEAAHARLMRLGFGYEEARRARVERACCRAERAFAARLTGAEPVLAEIDDRIARTGDPALFTDAARLGAVLERLRGDGCPEWLARALVAWAGRRAGAGRRMPGA